MRNLFVLAFLEGKDGEAGYTQRSEEISTKSYSCLVLDGRLFYIGFRKILPIFINHLEVIYIYTHTYINVFY